MWNDENKYIVWCWKLRKCRYLLGVALLFAVLSVKRELTCLRQAHIKPLDHLLIILFFILLFLFYYFYFTLLGFELFIFILFYFALTIFGLVALSPKLVLPLKVVQG